MPNEQDVYKIQKTSAPTDVSCCTLSNFCCEVAYWKAVCSAETSAERNNAASS
jgi:hypothetical protein